MEHKKKYPGGLKVLLLPLFIMLLGMFSTCYAKVSLTDDEVNYIIDNSFTYNPTENLYNNLWFKSSNSGISPNKQLVTSSLKSVFKQNFNTYNNLNFRDDLQDFFGYWASYSNVYRFYYTNEVNFGKFNYNHACFLFDTKIDNTYYFSIRFIDDNKNIVSVPFKCLEFEYFEPYDTSRPSYFTYSRFYSTSTATNNNKDDLCFRGSPYWNRNNFDKSFIENINGIINFSSTNAVYTNYDGANFYETPITKLLLSNYDGGIVPDVPDNPSTDNTGIITNNSGETTGQIDLSGIQNGLGNINQSINTQGQTIIDNQNENTQAIIDNQNNNTEQITETLTEQPNLSNTTISSGDIERCFGF